MLCARSGVSPCSFTTIIGTPVGIASAGISLVFLISNGIVKIFLKTMGKKKVNTERLLYWPQVNEITKSTKALINSNISHEEFTKVINEGQNYFSLKENI